MSQRAELRRQWREENRKREADGQPPLAWKDWGIGFVPLAESHPELAASAAHLRGES